MISYFVFALCSVLVIVSSHESSVKSSIDFLNYAQNKLKIIDNSNIILVIGNTGSGKSTLVHYVAGDFSKLTSIEPSNPYDFDFKIQDELDFNNDTINSSTVSRTFIPEVMIDDQQNVWYDCPGFGDTRNDTFEITTTVLIKRVIESASNIKIVMVVDYESVKNGHNRNDFDDLLTRTTQLIKNVKQFKDSLSLVVTKAPTYNIHRQKIIEISEENVKNTTAEFMLAHRSFLIHKGLFEEKISLIDALLMQSEEIYPKISVFWKPAESGRFNEIEKFVEDRRLIRKSILENTIYTQIQTKNFGFSLSAEAELYVREMVEQAVDNLFTIQLKNINDQVLNEMNQVIHLSHSFRRILEIIHFGQSKIEYYERNDTFNLNNIFELYRALTNEIGLQSIKERQLKQIEEDANDLNMLKSLITDVKFLSDTNSNQAIDYKSILNDISEFFQKSETDIQNNITIQTLEIIKNISINMTSVDQRLLVAVREKLDEKISIHSKLNLLHIGKRSTETVGIVIVTLEQRIKQFSTLIRNLNITSINIRALNQTKQDGSYLNELVALSKFETIIPVGNWILNSSSVINFISSEYVWYSFLLDVYHFLASYEVQKDVHAYNVVDLSNWGKSKKESNSQGLIITNANFREFTQRFTNLSEFMPTPAKLNELNQIIDTTLKSPVKYHFDKEMAIVEGNFVKSSHIQRIKNLEMKKINVFVADTFYVDDNLNLNGIENLELHILANKWHILQPTTFHLNGINGKSQTPPTTNGTAGKSGLPGTNSGNFFGVANDIINSNSLTVELIGGNGGNGQDGTGNQDIKLINGKNGTYTHGWYNELITYQNGPIKKIFTQANFSCSNIKKETASLIGKKVMYVNRQLLRNCCGVTGQGGAGGLGGTFGYFKFIHTSNNQRVLPNIVRKKGIDGIVGRNATACKTIGLQASSNSIYSKFDSCTSYFEKISHEPIDSSNCPDKYVTLDVTNTDVISTPPRSLIMSATIIAYKRFLFENMKNPILEKIVQQTYNAIESNRNIDDTVSRV